MCTCARVPCPALPSHCYVGNTAAGHHVTIDIAEPEQCRVHAVATHFLDAAPTMYEQLLQANPEATKAPHRGAPQAVEST